MPNGTTVSLYLFGEAAPGDADVPAEQTIRTVRPPTRWDAVAARPACWPRSVTRASAPRTSRRSSGRCSAPATTCCGSRDAGLKTMVVITDGIDNRFETDPLRGPARQGRLGLPPRELQGRRHPDQHHRHPADRARPRQEASGPVPGHPGASRPGPVLRRQPAARPRDQPADRLPAGADVPGRPRGPPADHRRLGARRGRQPARLRRHLVPLAAPPGGLPRPGQRRPRGRGRRGAGRRRPAAVDPGRPRRRPRLPPRPVRAGVLPEPAFADRPRLPLAALRARRTSSSTTARCDCWRPSNACPTRPRGRSASPARARSGSRSPPATEAAGRPGGPALVEPRGVPGRRPGGSRSPTGPGPSAPTSPARPVLRAWWREGLSSPPADTLAGVKQIDVRLPVDEDRKVELPGGTVVVVRGVQVEEHDVEVSPGERRRMPCLVVRLEHPKGKPVWARPLGVNAAGWEHRFYTSADSYTGLFWTTTGDEAFDVGRPPRTRRARHVQADLRGRGGLHRAAAGRPPERLDHAPAVPRPPGRRAAPRPPRRAPRGSGDDDGRRVRFRGHAGAADPPGVGPRRSCRGEVLLGRPRPQRRPTATEAEAVLRGLGVDAPDGRTSALAGPRRRPPRLPGRASSTSPSPPPTSRTAALVTSPVDVLIGALVPRQPAPGRAGVPRTGPAVVPGRLPDVRPEPRLPALRALGPPDRVVQGDDARPLRPGPRPPARGPRRDRRRRSSAGSPRSRPTC